MTWQKWQKWQKNDMTELTGLTVWGETVKKVRTKNYIPNVNKVRKVSMNLG